MSGLNLAVATCPLPRGGGWVPKRKKTRIRVQLTEHAEERWLERVGRPPGRLPDLIRVLLKEHIRGGLPVHHGRVMLPLDPELLDLPQPVVACLELPTNGTWRVVTFKPGREESVS